LEAEFAAYPYEKMKKLYFRRWRLYRRFLRRLGLRTISKTVNRANANGLEAVGPLSPVLATAL